LPETAVFERIYVLHRIEDLRLDPAASGYRAVVYGHSHKPGHFEKNGVLYVNPGSAGPRRFRLPITLALLDTDTWTVEYCTAGT
jgi:predicted phosphodiesterase